MNLRRIGHDGQAHNQRPYFDPFAPPGRALAGWEIRELVETWGDGARHPSAEAMRQHTELTNAVSDHYARTWCDLAAGTDNANP